MPVTHKRPRQIFRSHHFLPVLLLRKLSEVSPTPVPSCPATLTLTSEAPHPNSSNYFLPAYRTPRAAPHLAGFIKTRQLRPSWRKMVAGTLLAVHSGCFRLCSLPSPLPDTGRRLMSALGRSQKCLLSGDCGEQWLVWGRGQKASQCSRSQQALERLLSVGPHHLLWPQVASRRGNRHFMIRHRICTSPPSSADTCCIYMKEIILLLESRLKMFYYIHFFLFKIFLSFVLFSVFKKKFELQVR